MDSFELRSQVRLGVSQALLLLYRYLTGIYVLGDLSFVQFLSGYIRGRNRSLDQSRVLTVSGNGIGELEKALSLQWKLEYLETMAVSTSQMRIMRFLMGASPSEVNDFFSWTQGQLRDYPNLQVLLNSPGLVAYWEQQCELWQSPALNQRVHLVGGSPWDIPETQSYDAILMSHSQRLLRDGDAKSLLANVKKGGFLATVTPVIFRPDTLREQIPMRFSDSPGVVAVKQELRRQARKHGYDLPNEEPVHIHWTPVPEDVIHFVSFSIPAPLRSLLIGELLIQSLAVDLPDAVRLPLLESSLSDIPPGAGAGTEALLILLTEKGGN